MSNQKDPSSDPSRTRKLVDDDLGNISRHIRASRLIGSPPRRKPGKPPKLDPDTK